jgi:hypothetical protein
MNVVVLLIIDSRQSIDKLAKNKNRHFKMPIFVFNLIFLSNTIFFYSHDTIFPGESSILHVLKLFDLPASIASDYASAFSKTFFIFFEKSLRGIITL